jgi:hypothetical protein
MGLDAWLAADTVPLTALLRTVWLGERLTTIKAATIISRITLPPTILHRPNFLLERERRDLGFQEESANSLELLRLPMRSIKESCNLLIFNSWKRVKKLL